MQGCARILPSAQRLIWEGRPYASPQREFALKPLDKIEAVTIHRDGVEIGTGTLRAFWMGAASRKRRPLLEAFARTDGFASWNEMRDWFEETHGLHQPFEGQLIHWNRK